MTERDSDEQQEWMVNILDNLQEGIIVCDIDGHIVIANQAAKRFFPDPKKLQNGRSIYETCIKESLEQTLVLLGRKQKEGKRLSASLGVYDFACAVAESGALVNCRLMLCSRQTATDLGFVLSFDVRSFEDTAFKSRHTPLCSSVENLRTPLANLRAAAENLVTHPDMAPVMRRAFENVIAQESIILTEQFEALAAESRSQTLQQSHQVDISSADIANCLQYKCKDTSTSLLQSGIPVWLHADSLLLLSSLDFLLNCIINFTSASHLKIEAVRADSCMYLDFLWQGEPIPAAEIESWRDQPLDNVGVKNISLAEVLEMHNSDIWSKHHDQSGWSMVRIPLPIASR